MMSFIKLDEKHQGLADSCYAQEKDALRIIEYLERALMHDRWFSVGRTHIEQGFMALRKGITEKYKISLENKDK